MEPNAIFPSPDGKYELRLLPSQQRHSHEVQSPALFDTQLGICIFYAGPLWEAFDIVWLPSGGRLQMRLRRYDEPSTIFGLEIRLPEKTATLSTVGISDVLTGSLDAVSGEMGNVGSVRELFM